MMQSMENGQKTAEIPADKSQTGGFVDLDQEIERLNAGYNRQVVGRWRGAWGCYLGKLCQIPPPSSWFDKREADGIAPVLPLLKEFQELETFADFTAKLAEFELAEQT